MKTYIPISEDAEYRQMYDSYIQTVDNLNDTDFLYETMLSNGQVFFVEDGVYGLVNGQEARRNTNITISRSAIDNFTITDFKVFTRATNELLTLDINCNLAAYRDNKIHYLYIVLDTHGTYEVYDDMFQSDETKLLFARFIIGSNGDSKQFYMMLPFAGSADYIKGNQFYQVTEGLRVKVISNNSKQLTLSKAKIRFSAINFDDKASPDCITIDYEGAAVPIRYVTWDSTSQIPRTNWDASLVYTLDYTTIMNYSTGRTTRLTADKFSIQKLYYDVYTRCIVALYGDTAYDTMNEAIYAVDSVMNYPLPDGIEYLIPIACVIIQNTSDPFSDSNFRVINLDYNEQEVLDSDTFTRQQSAEAVAIARQAQSDVSTVSTNLNNHTGNKSNPHEVRLSQLKKSDGTAGAIDDSFAEPGLSVTALINRTLSQVGQTYYSKSGGPISGNVSISGSLSVTGNTTLSTVTTSGNITVGGDIIPSSNVSTSIGTSSKRLDAIFARAINCRTGNGDTSRFEDLETKNILPVSSSYAIGASNNRFGNMYTNYMNVYSALNSYGNTNLDGSVLLDGEDGGTCMISMPTTFYNSVSIDNSLASMFGTPVFSIPNGQLKLGNYSLVLGGQVSNLPTTTGYGIW